MSTFPVVKLSRVRATKINSCGLPIAGPGHYTVTKGSITLNLTKVNRDAEELEQTNGEGEVCVSDRTTPSRKWYTPALQLCNVDTELITMFNGWEQVLDYADLPIGFRDQPEVDGDFGTAIEAWTGGRGDDDCPTPIEDSIFSAASSGRSYGYWLFGATEWELGDIELGAQVSTFTLTGRTIAMPHWGKGPFNVAALDANGTPGRLLTPVGQKEHITMFRTPVAPPEPTEGARTLQIATIFTAPDYYFGGPGNAPAADVAPEQDATAEGYSLTITGTPTGGDFKLEIEYADTSTELTPVIAFNANAAGVKTGLVFPDDGFDASDWVVSGGTLPGGTVTIIPPEGVTISVGDNDLTGGTTPTVVVTPL